MQCEFIKPDGSRCNANSMAESEFCFVHNPDVQDAKELAVKSGGLAAKPRKEEQMLEPMPITSTDEILALLQDTINRIRTNPMTHQKANSIGYLASIALKSLEDGEMAEKLEMVNSLILERKVRIKK